MKNVLPIFLLLLFVSVAFFVNRARHGTVYTHHRVARNVNDCSERRKTAKKERLETLRSTAYLQKYIVDIINHGSSQHLGYKYGDMPAHMADEKAAPKIAAYVVTLSGRRPTHPDWVKAGRTFYISNCGGCHGEDGKGIHGTFPDLTRDPMLGIARRIGASGVSAKPAKN